MRRSRTGGSASKAQVPCGTSCGGGTQTLANFGELRRNGIDGGELVEFTLSWQEAGVPHKCHQAHVFRLRGDRIASDTVFCGGRWPEPLIAQMEQAQLEQNAVPGSG